MVAMLTPIADDLVQGPACHEPCVRGLGNTQHGVMVIGVAPGKDELRTGRPLTGPTGKIFNDLLSAVGFPRSKVYVTNMCCWHVDGAIKRHHMDQCFSRVEREIALVKPKLILLLGTEVCQYWTNKTINQARGAVLWSKQYNCYVMPMIQPAALFHDDSMTTNAQTDRVSNVAYDIVRDLRKIDEILTWPMDDTKNLVPHTVIRSRADAQRVLYKLPKDGTPIAVDVETNSGFLEFKNITEDELVCMAISDGTNTWVGEAKYWRNLAWPENVNWTFHHSIFDTAIIKRDLGVWLNIGEDTLLKSYTCDERPGYHSLKPLAREYEAAGFYEDKRVATEITPELLEYNAKDAAYTARLCTGKLAQWQQEEGTEHVYRSLLIPAANAFKEIQSRGARVDARLLKELEEEWGNERDAEYQKLQAQAHEAGWPDDTINPASWQQLSKLLYSIIGLRGCTMRCCAQRATPSTDAEHLDALKGQHPFIDALLTYRHLEHNYNIYIGGWVKHIHRHGVNHGRIHPTVKLFGTATGRRSYAEPAVQTIPRPSNEATKYGRLRQAIIPTDDRYEIAYADYSRAEIYTAYGYSRDPVMWEDLQKDYHLETAVRAMRKDRARMMADDNYREEMRRIAKTVTFGIMYGREAYSLSQEINSTVAEAQAYIDEWFRTNKVYAAWYQATLRELERTGEVVSITGRKRRFVLLQPNPRVLKQAVNFPVQSTAGDVTLQALIRLHPLLKQFDSHILFDVHDAIVFEINKQYRYEAMSLIKQVMESPPFPDLAPDFPCIPTEQYIGSSWGHARKLKDLAELRAA